MTKAFRVPSNCKGIDMQDGTRYNANRRGVVEVDDRHARHVRANTGDVAAVPLVSFGATGVDGERLCDECGRRNWPWVETCTRCGAELAPIPTLEVAAA